MPGGFRFLHSSPFGKALVPATATSMPKRKAAQAPEPAAAEKLELPAAAEAPSTSGGEPSKVVYLG
jgi:hypothetical protein